MAKDNRRIIHGVRLGDGRILKEGDEDALIDSLPKEEIERLFDQGDLDGDWGFKRKRDTEGDEANEADGGASSARRAHARKK